MLRRSMQMDCVLQNDGTPLTYVKRRAVQPLDIPAGDII